MNAVLDYFRRLGSRQFVRPWALCAPVIVLLICLPLLRPLRSPSRASEQELSRLAAIQALVENREDDPQAIGRTDFFKELRDLSANGPWSPGDAVPGTIVRLMNAGDVRTRPAYQYFSDRPPVFSFVLSGAYEGMYRLGYRFDSNPILVAYVLTLLGVTLPVAGAAGLIYRMGRLFELPRPARTALALAVVLGSGLIGYATALNPHAPAAALVLSACACLMHVQQSRRPARGGAWLVLCGFCAALAAAIDLSAGVFLWLLVLVIPAMRWGWPMRIGGVLLYVIGAAPPIVLHAVLTVPMTGDLRPGLLHPEMVRVGPAPVNVVSADEVDEPGPRPAAWKVATWRAVERTMRSLIGSRGLLTHYPVVVVGLLGIALVLRKHWPASMKVMAGATLLGASAVIVAYTMGRADWGQAMLGPRWFICFLPLLLFWAGAWLRRPHHKATWALAGITLAFSTAVSLIGAAAPFVKAAPGQYTVTAALKHMTAGEPATGSRGGREMVAGK